MNQVTIWQLSNGQTLIGIKSVEQPVVGETLIENAFSALMRPDGTPSSFTIELTMIHPLMRPARTGNTLSIENSNIVYSWPAEGDVERKFLETKSGIQLA